MDYKAAVPMFPEISIYKWSCNEESKRFPVENPATGKIITTIQAGDASSVDQAIHASQVAFEQRWRWVSPRDRSTYLFRCAEELEKHADELSILLCMENGKPQQDARMFDVNFLISVFRFFASICDKLPSEFYDRGSMYATVLYEPYGVCCGMVILHEVIIVHYSVLTVHVRNFAVQLAAHTHRWQGRTCTCRW